MTTSNVFDNNYFYLNDNRNDYNYDFYDYNDYYNFYRNGFDFDYESIFVQKYYSAALNDRTATTEQDGTVCSFG